MMSGVNGTNRQLLLRERPTGEVTDEHFELVEAAIPEPGPGEVLLRTRWLSFDPAQRGWLNDVRSYVPPVAIGEVMRADGIGEVIASNAGGIEVGQLLHTTIGWQEYVVIDPARTELFEVVPESVPAPELMLGALGITGLTAYFGMIEIGRPVAGDTVLVTSAAGATGSIAGQIADQGCGAGDRHSRRRREALVGARRRRLRRVPVPLRRRHPPATPGGQPQGYNVVFDNVGGSLLDAALFNIAERARVVLCGSISTGYKPQRPEVGLHYYQLLTTRAAGWRASSSRTTRRGSTKARAELAAWIADGRLQPAVRRVEGLEQAHRRVCSGCSAAATSASSCSGSDRAARHMLRAPRLQTYGTITVRPAPSGPAEQVRNVSQPDALAEQDAEVELAGLDQCDVARGSSGTPMTRRTRSRSAACR